MPESGEVGVKTVVVMKNKQVWRSTRTRNKISKENTLDQSILEIHSVRHLLQLMDPC